tara:strand:+ start:423 stop:599 length:177 start_codon:yes stop_codon:yes gene_type:complete
MDKISIKKQIRLHDLLEKIIDNIEWKHYEEAYKILKYEIQEEKIQEKDIGNILKSMIK